MKELTCKICDKYLGTIELGKIKHGTILLCTECYGRIDTLDNKHARNDSKVEMPEFFKDIFKGY